ncbi:translation elongation factor Ts [Oscillatoria laete-virens NRMC-F 0139]|nr:translation elongation factor Ts [Oscillatoria laete-virens]MDL5052318.1 translation elongation factor Ts [Oscillatoria laete-virens NRMC-F 0139]
MSTGTVEISAKLVGELRAKTNASMMDCKKALIATNGDMEAAVLELRKRGQASADKKSSRDTNEGVIAAAIQPGGQSGALVEVNCETDFVARNTDFQAFVKEVAETALQKPDTDFKDKCVAAVGTLGENISVRRVLKYDLQGQGIVASYIHLGAKVGVLIEVGCDQETAKNADAFRDFVKDITLHIAASAPLVVSRDQVDSAIIEREKVVYREQVKDKPAAAIEKIIEGKVNKFLAGVALLDQAYVKSPDITVKEHMANVGKAIGGTISIRRFVRWQLGEEIAA